MIIIIQYELCTSFDVALDTVAIPVPPPTPSLLPPRSAAPLPGDRPPANQLRSPMFVL